MEQKSFREVLRGELQRRQDKNPAYSLRAYARHLGISPAQLSQILSGKRVITMKTYKRIAEIFHFSPLESMQFVEEITNSASKVSKTTVLSEDQFRLISDWWHFAILCLGKLKRPLKDPVYIAKRLGITLADAKMSVERLERLGVLESGGTEIKCICDPIRVMSETPSTAIQRSHLQTLQLASEKLSQVDVKKRDYSAITMAIDPKNLDKAKKAIEDFQDKMVKLLEPGEPSEVYTFSCQLFPVSIISEKSSEGDSK